MEVVRTSIGRGYATHFDGIRGYGFLLVFSVHYFQPYLFSHLGSDAVRIMTAFEIFDRLAVPIFFVLSGYLIGGILHGTVNREGYFRIFYLRRVVRVLPIYFLALILIGIIETCLKFHLDLYYWSHFLFIQNLLPGYGLRSNPIVLVHYWSLATEEQFYLLWPLVVWFVPKRRNLLGVAAVFIALSFVFRFAAPHMFASPEEVHYFTPMRADAILLGVMLSLIQGETIFTKIKTIAKVWLPVSVIGMLIWALSKGESWPQSFRGEQYGIPLLNFTAASCVVLAMKEGSWLNRACNMRWIRWFGRRSYSLYIVHFTYYHWFMNCCIPFLAKYLPFTLAAIVANLIAFLVTVGLGVLSYRFIETPMQNLKQRRLQYGPLKREEAAEGLRAEIPVRVSA
jgi:peptidoglycan/LPS O-acetylase OafA/YrhL